VKFAVIALVLSSLLGMTASAEDTAAGDSQAILTVMVTNGTAKGAAVTGNTVAVRIYQHQQLTGALDGEVDANGRAVFENVPTGEHVVAIGGVKHQDMMFNSRPVALKPTESNYSTHVTVYDVSDDNSNLSVGVHHFIIKAQPDYLMITEYMQLKNPSDMAVISKQRDAQGLPVVLKIMLPEGFKNLRCSSYFEEAALEKTEEGFYDTMAIPPGDNHQAIFSYTIDINSATMDIVKKFSLPTAELVLFSQLGQERIKGLGPPDGKMTLADKTSADYFNLSGLNTGDTVTFQVTGFNVPASQRQSWIIMSVVFGLAALVAVLRLLRPKQKITGPQ